MTKPTNLTDEDFEKTVLASPVALIDFWVTNCQPCSVIAVILDGIAEKYAGRVFVGKIQADKSPKAVSYFNVTTAPTVLIIKDGRETDRITLQTIDTSRPKECIEEILIARLDN